MEQNQTIPKYTTADIKITPKEIECVIIDIKICKAKELFGNETKNPDKEMYLLILENKEFNVKTEQPIPVYPVGNVPDNSKLGMFIKRYGKFEVGMIIKLEKDNKGFWKLIV